MAVMAPRQDEVLIAMKHYPIPSAAEEPSAALRGERRVNSRAPLCLKMSVEIRQLLVRVTEIRGLELQSGAYYLVLDRSPGAL